MTKIEIWKKKLNMPASSLQKSIRIILFGSLGWAVLLGLDVFPFLRGGSGWRWPYALSLIRPTGLLVLILVLVIYLGGAWGISQREKANSIPLLLWVVLGSVILTIAVLYVNVRQVRYELYTRTLSGLTTGWHYAAVDIGNADSTADVLHEWPAFMQEHQDTLRHLALSPPGLPLIYHAANKSLEAVPRLASLLANPLRAEQCHNFRFASYSDAELASTWLGIASPLWGGLTVIPLYWLERRVYGFQSTFSAVIWWPLIPGFLMFTPTPYTIFPMFAVTVVVLLVLGLVHENHLLVFAAGVVMSLTTFVTFTLLPVIFLVGCVTLVTHLVSPKDTKRPWHWSVVMGGWFVVGLSVVWVIYYILCGVPVWMIFISAMGEHLALDRPYLPWLILHLNDFFMFTGWPLILLAGLSTWSAIKHLQARKQLSTGHVLTLSVVITLIVLDFSGISRGESGRVWLFLTPFFLLSAASVLPHDEYHHLGWAVSTVQAIMVLSMVAFVHVIDSGLSAPPSPPPPPDQFPSASYIPSGAVFDHALKLVNYAGQIEIHTDVNGDVQPVLLLWLNWESIGQVKQPYYIGVIPVSPSGHPLEAAVLQPFDTAYPVTCWLPDSSPLLALIKIPLYASDLEGGWWASLSFINGNTGVQPLVILPDGSHDTQVGIGPFYLSEEQ